MPPIIPPFPTSLSGFVPRPDANGNYPLTGTEFADALIRNANIFNAALMCLPKKDIFKIEPGKHPECNMPVEGEDEEPPGEDEEPPYNNTGDGEGIPDEE